MIAVIAILQLKAGAALFAAIALFATTLFSMMLNIIALTDSIFKVKRGQRASYLYKKMESVKSKHSTFMKHDP